MVCADLATKQDIADLRRDILYAIKYGEIPEPEPYPYPDNPYEGSDVIPAAVPAAIPGIVALVKAITSLKVSLNAVLPVLTAIGGSILVFEQVRDALVGGDVDGGFERIEELLTGSITTTINDGFTTINERLDALNVPSDGDTPPVADTTSSTTPLDKLGATNLLNGLEHRLRDYINGHHWGTKQAILDRLNIPLQEPDYNSITNVLQNIKSGIAQEIRGAVGSINIPDIGSSIDGLRDVIVRQHIDTRSAIDSIKLPSFPDIDLGGLQGSIDSLGNRIGSNNLLGDIVSQLLTSRTAVLGAISAGYGAVTNFLSSRLDKVALSGDVIGLSTHISTQHQITRAAFPSIDYAQFPTVDYERIREQIATAHSETVSDITTIVNALDISSDLVEFKNSLIDDANLTREKVEKIDLTKTEENLKKHQTDIKTAIITQVQECCFEMDYTLINNHTTREAVNTRKHITTKDSELRKHINREGLIRHINDKHTKTTKDVNGKIRDKHTETTKAIKDDAAAKRKETRKQIDEGHKNIHDTLIKISEATGIDLFPITIRVGKGRSYQLRSIPSMVQNMMARLGLNIFPKKYITTPIDGDVKKRKVKEVGSLGTLLNMIGEAVYAPFYPLSLPAKGLKFLDGIPGSGAPKVKSLAIKNTGDYLQWFSDRIFEIPISQFGGDPDDANKYGDVYLRTCKIILRENYRKDKPSFPPFETVNGGPANYYSISLKHLKPGLTWKIFKDVFSGWEWGPYLIEATLESRYTINFRSSSQEVGVRAMKKVISKLIDENAIRITATYEEVHTSIMKQSKTIYPEQIIITLKKQTSDGKNPDISGKKYTSEHVRIALWTDAPPWGTPRTLTDYQTI